MLTINPTQVNASAAKRILGLPQSRKIEISVEATAIRISYRDRQSAKTATLTPDQFAAEFERSRRESAKECIATPHKRGPWGELFKVVGSAGEVYYVEASDRALACTCEDWHQHESICKHGYAVLALVGCTSLEAYQQARAIAFPRPVHSTNRPAQIKGISVE